MAGEREPLHLLTAEDSGPIVIVLSISLLVASLIFAAIRFLFALTHKTPFGLDDASYVLANVFAATTSVLLCLACQAGLGRFQSALSVGEADKVLKLVYATQFPEVFAQLFAKASIALLVARIVPQSSKVKSVLFVIIAIWAIVHLFAVAFQCPLPSPWNTVASECSTHGVPLYPAIALNALTDILLALWIVPGVLGIKIRRRRRVSVLLLFGLRICVCAPAITQLVLLRSSYHSEDQTRSSIVRVILNQVTVHLSVVCSTLPRTNQFLSSLSGAGLDVRVPLFETRESEKRSFGESKDDSAKDPKGDQSDEEQLSENTGQGRRVC